MNVQTILAAIAFIQKYGPALIQIGGEAAHAVHDLLAFIQQWRDHAALTAAERASLDFLLTSDPSTWGITGVVPAPSAPQPAPAPPTSEPAPAAPPRWSIVYNEPLDVKPDTTALLPGDVLYQIPDGKFYVASHGFPFTPPDGWTKLWPEG